MQLSSNTRVSWTFEFGFPEEFFRLDYQRLILWTTVTRWVAFRFRLYWCHSEDLFVCFGAKPTQRAWTRDRKWRREGKCQRRQREAVDNRPEIAVQRRTQSAEGGSEKMEAGQSRDESAFLVALWKFSAKYTPAIACNCSESCTKVSQTPSSCAWSWPRPVFVRLFFSSTLSVVFCVSVKNL